MLLLLLLLLLLLELLLASFLNLLLIARAEDQLAQGCSEKLDDHVDLGDGKSFSVIQWVLLAGAELLQPFPHAWYHIHLSFTYVLQARGRGLGHRRVRP